MGRGRDGSAFFIFSAVFHVVFCVLVHRGHARKQETLSVRGVTKIAQASHRTGLPLHKKKVKVFVAPSLFLGAPSRVHAK